MVRTGGAHQTVGQHLAALPLDQLLKRGLVVPAAALLLFPVQNEALDDLPGGADAAVQIDRRQHGLHCVRHDGRPLPAAAGVLALAQLQVGAQLQLLGHLHQAALTHQGRPGTGQVALRQVRMGPVEIVGGDHAQHRVPQELQPLVALSAGVLVLIGVGAVSQCVLQQGPVLKGIAQLLLQLLHLFPSQ